MVWLLRHPFRVAAVVAVASTILGASGCGGGSTLASFSSEQVPINALQSAQRAISSLGDSVSPSGFLSGEVLTGSSVHVNVHGTCGSGGKTTFDASGPTTGPYPGTFTAKGHWQYQFHVPGGFTWHFYESFRIKSRPHTIRGTIVGNGHGTPCQRFDGQGLTYKAGNWGSGPATTGGISEGVLVETLE